MATKRRKRAVRRVATKRPARSRVRRATKANAWRPKNAAKLKALNEALNEEEFSIGSGGNFILLSHGDLYHPRCAREIAREIRRATREDSGGDRAFAAFDANYEDGEMFCDGCGEQIIPLVEE